MLNTQYQAFRDATKVNSKTKARGSNMHKIDVELEAYWDEIHAENAAREYQLLGNLVGACSEWLKKKRDKSDYQTNLLGKRTNYINELFVRRKGEVSRLGTEAIKELYARMLSGGALTADQRGELQFAKRKMGALGSSVFTPRKGLQSLGTFYKPERESFLKSNKTVAISGSGTHDVLDTIGRRMAVQGGLLDMTGSKGLARQAIAISKKNVDTLTVKDFEILKEIGAKDRLSGQVNYLRKRERYKYMVTIDNAGLMIDDQQNPITTPNRVIVYAMNEYGSLFVKSASPLHGMEFFNHSSFNAGKAVICAGEITIAAGKLQTISNASGHYKPGRANMHNCLEVLASDGIDLSEAVVDLMVWANGAPELHRYVATDFLANPNGTIYRLNP